jgi:hypothetical protein
MFESFVIDSDFLVNFDLKNKENKLNTEDEKLKCYPKRTSNQAPYKKIEFEIQKEPHWPPITNHNNSNFVPITAIINNNSNNIKENINTDSLPVNSIINNSLNRSNSRKKQEKYDDNNLEMNSNSIANSNKNESELFEEFTKI